LSDRPQISLDQAISSFAGGTPEEQPTPAEQHNEEDQETQEAPELSESEDETEEQPDEQDSEEEEAGETDDEDTDDDQEEEEQTFTLNHGGKEETVTLSELRDGYLRQADYTRKTQAVTEQRKALDTQAEQVGKKYEEAAAILGAVSEQLLGTPPAKPDISLIRSDPQAYEEQKANYEQWHALKAGFDDWRGKVVQERDQESGKKRAEVAKAEGQRFAQAFEVKDEAGLNAKVSEIHTYLHDTFGYAPQELAGMIDHRAYVIADKARRYDALMAENKPKAELKAKKAKLKPVTSGNARRKPKRQSERDQALNRFNEATSRPDHKFSRKEALDAAVEAYVSGKGGS
jgi:hypothetical protein